MLITKPVPHEGPKTEDTHCLREVKGIDTRFHPRGREEPALQRGFLGGSESE